MPLSRGSKDIAENDAWAENTTRGTGADDDRINPDDGSLTPAITISDGWPSSFSDGTNIPRRKVMNELLYRVSGSEKNLLSAGVLPWDSNVDTVQYGIKQAGGMLWRALQADTSPRVNPTDAGQTRWEMVGAAAITPPTQRHRFTTSQTWTWPYSASDVARASVVLFAPDTDDDEAQLVTGGSTYTTDGDTDGYVSQTLTGISNNQSFAFTITGDGFAEVYPQI